MQSISALSIAPATAPDCPGTCNPRAWCTSRFPNISPLCSSARNYRGPSNHLAAPFSVPRIFRCTAPLLLGSSLIERPANRSLPVTAMPNWLIGGPEANQIKPSDPGKEHWSSNLTQARSKISLQTYSKPKSIRKSNVT